MSACLPDDSIERLALREYQTTVRVPLDAGERAALSRVAPSVAITPSAGTENLYDLTPGSWVGAVRVGRYALAIRPKFPIDRVLFLLSYAVDPRQWLADGFGFEQREDLVEAVVPGFLAQVRRAVRQGLLHGYREEEDRLATVRGRIRFDDQLRKWQGLLPPVEVRYDEFTADITENRMIKAAIERLGRLRLRSDDVQHSLRAFDSLLASVTLVPYLTSWLPEVHYNRLNEHYRPAVELARLILRATTFDLGHGQVSASAFLVDMNQAFEDFVAVALREALRLTSRDFPRGDRCPPLHLDAGAKVRLMPDLSWWDGRRCRFVGDVKYKRSEAGLNSDLYQLLAYCVGADLANGLLIYAAGESEGVEHSVVQVGKELRVRTLDLSRHPAEILDQIDRTAASIRGDIRMAET